MRAKITKKEDIKEFFLKFIGIIFFFSTESCKTGSGYETFDR